MIPEWPPELIKFERSGWQVSEQDARRRTPAESGPPMFRRRYSSVPRLVGLSIILNRNERAIFDTFYHSTCAEGSRRFWMPDPSSTGWHLLADDGGYLLAADGSPLLISARWLCAWGDQLPVEALDGDVDFQKSFSVWVLP